MQGFETEIYRMWNIEKYNAIKNGNIAKHNKKWHNVHMQYGANLGPEQNNDINVQNYVGQYINSM